MIYNNNNKNNVDSKDIKTKPNCDISNRINRERLLDNIDQQRRNKI